MQLRQEKERLERERIERESRGNDDDDDDEGFYDSDNLTLKLSRSSIRNNTILTLENCLVSRLFENIDNHLVLAKEQT